MTIHSIRELTNQEYKKINENIHNTFHSLKNYSFKENDVIYIDSKKIPKKHFDKYLKSLDLVNVSRTTVKSKATVIITDKVSKIGISQNCFKFINKNTGVVEYVEDGSLWYSSKWIIINYLKTHKPYGDIDYANFYEDNKSDFIRTNMILKNCPYSKEDLYNGSISFVSDKNIISKVKIFNNNNQEPLKDLDIEMITEMITSKDKSNFELALEMLEDVNVDKYMGYLLTVFYFGHFKKGIKPKYRKFLLKKIPDTSLVADGSWKGSSGWREPRYFFKEIYPKIKKLYTIDDKFLMKYLIK